MKVASYTPGQRGAVQLAISADDCSLHFEANQLTAKQRADDTASKDLIAMLQCASQFVARPGDRVGLYEGFNARPWLETLARYQGFFTELGLDPAPTSAQSFRPREGFYDAFADRPAPTDQLTVSDVCLADAGWSSGNSRISAWRWIAHCRRGTWLSRPGSCCRCEGEASGSLAYLACEVRCLQDFSLRRVRRSPPSAAAALEAVVHHRVAAVHRCAAW